jgi:hypothetical protein
VFSVQVSSLRPEELPTSPKASTGQDGLASRSQQQNPIRYVEVAFEMDSLRPRYRPHQADDTKPKWLSSSQVSSDHLKGLLDSAYKTET